VEGHKVTIGAVRFLPPLGLDVTGGRAVDLGHDHILDRIEVIQVFELQPDVFGRQNPLVAVGQPALIRQGGDGREVIRAAETAKDQPRHGRRAGQGQSVINGSSQDRLHT
jgi:hypothetical protein